MTIIVAAEGDVKVPKVASREELTKALNKLGALRSEQVKRLSASWFLAYDDTGVLGRNNVICRLHVVCCSNMCALDCFFQ